MAIGTRYRCVFLLLAGCTAAPHHGSRAVLDDESESACIDRDSDGFGESCDAGADCDDHDPAVHRTCVRCATPNVGCPCAQGSVPAQCFLEPTEDDEGVVMCHEGTRYCREGRWSGCESLRTYAAPDET